MTKLDNGTIATDLNSDIDNAALLEQGYSIRHIETYHRDIDHTCIIWEAPELTEADLPY